jgi:hypothetical protein
VADTNSGKKKEGRLRGHNAALSFTIQFWSYLREEKKHSGERHLSIACEMGFAGSPIRKKNTKRQAAPHCQLSSVLVFLVAKDPVVSNIHTQVKANSTRGRVLACKAKMLCFDAESLSSSSPSFTVRYSLQTEKKKRKEIADKRVTAERRVQWC